MSMDVGAVQIGQGFVGAIKPDQTAASSAFLFFLLHGEDMTGRAIKHGSTDQSTVIRIVDSTTGLPETGVEHNTSGIDLWYRREGAAKVSITEVALASASAAHSDGGIEHIGDGYYRLDLPDAAVASSSTGVQIGGTVTGMVVFGIYHPLVAYDPQDTVRMGMTALPNAAAEASGGLFTRGTGAGQINQASNGQIDGNLVTWKGSAPAGLTDTDKVQASVQHMADNVIAASKIASNAITSAKIAASAIGASQIATGALTSAKFAAGAFDAVWTVTTRLLTAGTNIVLAKGVGVTGFNDLSAAQVNAQLVDVMETDTHTEVGQGAPPATASYKQMFQHLYKAWRNKKDNDGNTTNLYADDGTTVDQKQTTSESGGTVTKSEWVSGP